jgi:hypothetical protein
MLTETSSNVGHALIYVGQRFAQSFFGIDHVVGCKLVRIPGEVARESAMMSPSIERTR